MREQKTGTGSRVEGRIGRDELNLTQFPLCVLRRPRQGSESRVEYRDGDRGWKIVGHPDYGLPKSCDVAVYLCLLELAKEQGFERRTVFCRHDLISRLGWSDCGASYERLSVSLALWLRVVFTAERFYYDKANRERVGKKEIVLISGYLLPQRGDETDRTSGVMSAWVDWGEEFWKSVRSGYVKRLDLGVYLSLRSALSQALYRYLDARRYDGKAEYCHDLRDLACQRLGLSPSMDRGQLRRELSRAHEELMGLGFLSSVDYRVEGRSVIVVYRFAAARPTPLMSAEEEARMSRFFAEYERHKARKRSATR